MKTRDPLARGSYSTIHIGALLASQTRVLSARNPIFSVIIASDFPIALGGRLIKRIGLLRAYRTHVYVAPVRLILGIVDSDVQIPFPARVGCLCVCMLKNVLTLTSNFRTSCVRVREFDPPFKFSTRQASDRDPLQEDHPDG